MRKSVRPLGYLGGVFSGVGITVVAFGMLKASARQEPAPAPVPGVERQAIPSDGAKEAVPPPAAEKAPVAELLSPPAVADNPPLAAVDVVKVPVSEPAAEADPEQVATAFVERTRNEAISAVDSLRQEAEALRQRLKKVEAALRRWQGVLFPRLRTSPGRTNEARPGAIEPALEPAAPSPTPAAAELTPSGGKATRHHRSKGLSGDARGYHDSPRPSRLAFPGLVRELHLSPGPLEKRARLAYTRHEPSLDRGGVRREVRSARQAFVLKTTLIFYSKTRTNFDRTATLWWPFQPEIVGVRSPVSSMLRVIEGWKG